VRRPVVARARGLGDNAASATADRTSGSRALAETVAKAAAPSAARRPPATRARFDARFQGDGLRLLYAHWQTVRGARPAPARHEIDPAAIATVLPSIAIFDVEEAPRRYRIRLMGSRNVTWYGADPTGCCLDELDIGNGRAELCATLGQVVALVVPGHMTGEYTRQEGQSLRYERLFMPLSNDGRRVDMLLGAVCRLPPEAPIIGHSFDLPDAPR